MKIVFRLKYLLESPYIISWKTLPWGSRAICLKKTFGVILFYIVRMVFIKLVFRNRCFWRWSGLAGESKEVNFQSQFLAIFFSEKCFQYILGTCSNEEHLTHFRKETLNNLTYYVSDSIFISLIQVGKVGINSYRMYRRTNLNIFNENRPDFSETFRRSFSKLAHPPHPHPTCPESNYTFWPCQSVTPSISSFTAAFSILVTLLLPAPYFSLHQPVYFCKIAVSRVIRTDPAK